MSEQQINGHAWHDEGGEPMRTSFAALQEMAGECSAQHGWHEQYHEARKAGHKFELDHIATKLALIHSEVTEALEELRNGEDPDTVQRAHDMSGRPLVLDGFPVELADIVIRVMDLAYVLDIDLESVVREKINFNAQRPRMHGGKKF